MLGPSCVCVQRLGALESQSFTLLHTALLLLYTQNLPYAAWQATCDTLSRLAALVVAASPTRRLSLGASAPRFCGASFLEASRAYPSWVPFCLAIETLVSILHMSMSVPATSAAVVARRLALILVVVFAEVAAHAHIQLMVPLTACLFGLVMGHFLERSQRQSLLTIFRLSEQLQKQQPSLAHEDQRALIRRVFTGAHLPRLVLQASAMAPHSSPSP